MEAKDPVCGARIDSQANPPATKYSGHNYYFCSSVCRREFEASPLKYSGAYPAAGLETGPSTQHAKEGQYQAGEHSHYYGQ